MANRGITGQYPSNRIIHVPRRFTDREWGGTETVVLELAKSQVRRGLEPEIVTSMALDPRNFQTYQSIPIRRFNYLYPYLGLTPNQKMKLDFKGGNLFSFQILDYLIRQRQVRVFHAHVLKRLGASVRTAARLKGIPYVVSIHGGAYDVPKSEVTKMLEPVRGHGVCEWGKIIGAALGSRKVLDDADWVICVGESEFEIASRSLQHDRISYIPNGVDDRKFRGGFGSVFREKYKIPKEHYVIGCIGRIDFQKNQRVLIESFSELLKVNRAMTLVLVGGVTQTDYRDELNGLAAHLGVSQHIRWLDGVPNDSEDLVNAYHASDVIVLPSIHEPFGIVVLEAWSAGKPVIVSDVGGLKSLVDDEVTGLKFNPESSGCEYDLVRKVLWLQQHKKLAAQLAERGHEEVRSKYRWSIISSRVEQVYGAAEDSFDRRVRWRRVSRKSSATVSA